MKKKVVEIVEGGTYIDGVEYVAKEKKKESNIKIVILQRGWVYIGRFERIGNDCKLTSAYCIRKWGTTKGLAELVNGVTSSTILDKTEGVVEFDWLTVVHTITVNEEKWKQIV